jgi:type I restriction enzyme S subunit
MKPGYKQTEVGVIPEEWEDTTVGAMIAAGIIEKPLDGNHGNIHPKSGDFVDWGIPFVMANNVKGGGVDLVNCSFIRKQQADSLQKGFSITGDVLLTHKATIGNTAVVGEMGFPYIMLTPQVTYYRVNDESRLSNLYLRYYFETVGFQSVLRALAGGGTRSYIGISAQHQLPVIFPTSLPEQRAIAEALSDVDGLLGGLDRLIAKKRDLKQAAMQQLLTGQTRLSGFHGEWEVKRLGDFGKCLRGVSYKGDSDLSTHDTTQTKRLLRSNNVQNAVVVTDEVQFVNAVRVSSHQILKRGDILICMANGSKSLVGKAGIFMLCDGHEYTFGAFMGCFRTDSANAIPAFIFYLFLTNRYRDYINNLLAGSSINNLRPSSIESLEFCIPPLPEQTAIAEILIDMDAELTALEQRREKTRALKQAMMQELLTGKTRLL